jgi:hypothetical protein
MRQRGGKPPADFPKRGQTPNREVAWLGGFESDAACTRLMLCTPENVAWRLQLARGAG